MTITNVVVLYGPIISPFKCNTCIHEFLHKERNILTISAGILFGNTKILNGEEILYSRQSNHTKSTIRL